MFFVAVVLYFVPPIHEKLAWRVDNLRVRIFYLIHPPQEVAFHPSGQSIATPTSDLLSPSPTSTPTITPILTKLATSTVTSTPPPSSVILDNITFVDQMGRYNYCGPSNLAMALEYWGWKGEQGSVYQEVRDQIGAVVKPGENDTSKNFVERSLSDVNVMPYELVDYTNEHTSLKALFRYGGDADLLKRLIAAGFPPITEKGLYEPLRPDNSVQWGGHYSFTTGYDDGKQEFVWLFEISGAVPPAHLMGGYAGAVSECQPPMYFRLGGGSIKGVSKPGEIVWSRIFVDGPTLKADIGRARAVALPAAETELYGVTRDQLMARHKSNHVQVTYAPDAAAANLALATKAAMFRQMGIEVAVCGTEHGL